MKTILVSGEGIFYIECIDQGYEFDSPWYAMVLDCDKEPEFYYY